ncbi:hypothetical protein Tco_0643995 [Tanacetum coccineum]
MYCESICIALDDLHFELETLSRSSFNGIYINNRRFLAQQRAAAIRSKPPIRTQLRNQMMTYLKHVGGKKHADLKNKNFEEIQVLYKKVKRSDKDFIATGSAKDERQIKEMNEESKDPNVRNKSSYDLILPTVLKELVLPVQS